MSVDKTANDGTVSVFAKEGVNVFKEEDVLITCKGELILIEVRDSHGRYQTPMATTTSIQTSAENTQTSQQCLQSPIN
jgi:hypothetical protein